MIWKDLASWNAIQGCHQPQIFRFQSFFFCNGNSLLHAAKLHHSDAFLVDFILELRTEADLEISSPDVVESKVFKQGSIFRDVSFSQTFQIRNFLKSPVDKNTAKVKPHIDDFPQTIFKVPWLFYKWVSFMSSLSPNVALIHRQQSTTLDSYCINQTQCSSNCGKC